VNLEDITKSDPVVSSRRPLVKSLAGSNYTFDATISFTRGGKIRYVPIRGLWDTGSDALSSMMCLRYTGLPAHGKAYTKCEADLACQSEYELT
jgi:hypothetical protein